MKKITKQQFIQKTSRRRNPIVATLDELEVGKALEVKKSEYKGKTAFPSLVAATFRKRETNKKFQTRSLADRSGWAVLRIK